MQIAKKNHKIIIFILLILGIFVYTFVYSVQRGMHQVMPEAVNRHVNSLGIAISGLRYGLGEYSGYRKVTNTLSSNGITNVQKIISKYNKVDKEELLADAGILNRAIRKAANVEEVSSDGRYYLFREDKGLVDYYKTAFKIFGYKVESFFHLYFLLLALSILSFFITFYKRFDLLQILLLFVCGHFVIVAVAPIVGIELQTVHNARFLPVLAILPAIYLGLIILGQHRFTKRVFACTLMQAAILIFIIHIRSSAVYQIIFLSFLLSLSVFWFWANNRKIGKYVFKRVIFWPLAIVFIGFFLVKAYLAIHLQYPYTSATEKHYFWYTVYLGLAAHPDSMSKYGIEFDDHIAHDAVKKHLVAQYGTEVSYDTELMESVLKKEFFKIFKKDPRFVIESYLYKFPLFIKNYFNPLFGAIRYLFRPILLVIIVAGSLLTGEVLLKRWFQYFYLLILCLAFSLLPSILAMPELYLIADTALLFTILIYFLIAGGVCYIIKRFSIYSGRKSTLLILNSKK